jgi:lipopolysaccharide export system permease protein
VRNEILKENKISVSLTVFRYVLLELFFSFVIAFFFFFFIFFVNYILLMAKEVLTKHVPFGQVFLLVLFSLPMVIAMSAPFASLVGTLMTVGRLTSDNEILVMLSSGLSYKAVFIPAVVMGIVISLLSFFANDVLLPAGTAQYNKLWRRILASSPTLEIEANSVKRFKDTVIVTGGVSGSVIDSLLIMDRTQDGERRIIMANSAELKDSGREYLSMDLEKAFIQSIKEIAREDYDYARTESLQYKVSSEDIIQAIVSIGPREMSSRDVYSETKVIRQEFDTRVNSRKSRLAVQAAALENILRAGPEADTWNSRISNISGFKHELQSLAAIQSDISLAVYIIELHRKFSIPFGAFCFVFLAVSLGLMAKKSGQTVGFIFGILIAVVYWSLLFFGYTVGLRIKIPPFLSMWLPNILSLSIGGFLAVRRVRK